MRLLLLIIAVLLSTACFSQSQQRVYDSLSKVTGKQVVGYSKAYHNTQLTYTIWYISFYDYVTEQTLYTAPLDKTSAKQAYDAIARETSQWITGYTITYFKNRETFIIQYLTSEGEERSLIWHTKTI